MLQKASDCKKDEETFTETSTETSYKKMKITLIKILCCIFSVLTYIADIGSDVYVAVTHHLNGSKIYFYLTILFIVLPAIIMTLTSVRWYMNDKLVRHIKVSKTHWIIRAIFLIFLMAPALRNAEALYYAWKSSKCKHPVHKENYIRRVIYENTDASFLRLIEAFLECAPQLILQIYIIAQTFCNGSPEITTTVIIQLISIAISLISMTNAIVSYSRNLRESLDYKKELPWCISIFPFLCQFFELTARVLTLGLFASVLLPYFFLVCGMHFGIMLLWILFMNTDFCDNNKYAEFVYNMVLSFIYIFCFINPKDDRTQLRQILYYSLVFVENTIFIILWHNHCLIQARLVVLIMVFLCFILAIIIKVFYYVLLHPTRGILFRETIPEERNVRSQSKSVAEQFTLTKDLIDKTEKDKEVSEEMKTAVLQNGKPTEVNNLNEEQVECSEL